VLAPAGAKTVALIGCGEQAGSHIAAMRAVRPIERFVVWGRDPARATAFAVRHGIEQAATIAQALDGADIVVTATPAREPLIDAGMLRPGMHINAVGASVPSMQEFTADVVPAVRFVTDYLPSMEAQAAEVIAARAQGLIGRDHPMIEIGAILNGTEEGRRGHMDITFYRSLGIAAQDMAAAHEILARAEAAGIGTVIDME
jgi:ornithine cyclodeaminase